MQREVCEKSLLKGTSKSCGIKSNHCEDLSGKMFGKWVVKDRADDRYDSRGRVMRYWNCQCTCDDKTEREVLERALINGKSKSCGCYQKIVLRETQRNRVEDITNRKFGRLTPIYYDDNYLNSNNRICSVWWCKCDCGKEELVPVSKGQLVTRQTRSCGCLQKELSSQRNKENVKRNTYDLSGDYGIGYDCNGDSFIFDKEDYAKIKDYTWKLFNDGTSPTYYVNAHVWIDDKRTTLRLSRLIMNCNDDNLEVDHINRNGTDNRKENLRICNRYDNSHNKTIGVLNKSSIYGVNYDKNSGMFRARIGFEGKRYDLGLFSDFNQAALVRLEKEKELYKDFMPKEHIKILNYIHNGGKVKYGDKALIKTITK